MSNIPVTAWPKPYLLDLYEKSIEHGCIRVKLEGDKEKAASLQAAFYRLRRRTDSQHKAFIQPEYHLVTCTWEPERGTMLFVYNRLPDGTSLPEIEILDPHEARDIASRPEVIGSVPPLPSDPDLQIDLDALMGDLLKGAKNKLL